MKKIILLPALFILTAGIFISCKKGTYCEGCKENNKPPTAIAGSDQVITLPTDSISLDGSASNDQDGTIGEWLWKKIEGPASYNISSSATAKILVKNLVAGTYQFELKVKDDKGLFATDTMQVTVNSASPINRPPVANAGEDQTITLPVNSITVNGSGSADPDNNITNYAWTKISGPSSFNITNATAAQTQVTNLVEGVYQFEFKVTDAGGLMAKDTMQVTVNAPITDPSNDVYVAGLENIGGRGVAKYWKNGQAISLADGTTDTYANSITVLGNDVYVAGNEKRGNMYVAKYWKNGQAVTLTNGSASASANSIAVEGSDVYVAGYENNGSQDVAKYWKNSVAISLTNGSTSASAISIVVVGGDVYVAGWESNEGRTIAKYWKNGVGVSLTDTTINSFASSIAVVGNDVYISGAEYNDISSAVYWKNGQKVVLSNKDAAAFSITVIGTDVYAAGFMWQGGDYGYWKNGNWVRLNGAPAYATSIIVIDNDIYVTGCTSQENAGYWKNGQMVFLTNGSSGRASSMVVVRR